MPDGATRSHLSAFYFDDFEVSGICEINSEGGKSLEDNDNQSF